MKVLVIGGSGRIGSAIARSMTAAGFDVIISGRGPKADIMADLLTEEGLDAVAGAALEVDILVFSAGIWRFAGLNRFDRDESERIMRTNLLAPIEITRRIIPEWRRRGSGILVYILSELAHKPQAGGALYVASKHALLGFARSLRLETRDADIRVITVSPGIVGGERGMGADLVAEAVMGAIEDPSGGDEISIPTPG